MSKIEVRYIKPGMILGESIYAEDSGKLLLKQGMKLNKFHIQKLMELSIKSVEIPDEFTTFIDLSESMESILNMSYNSSFSRFTSDYPSGNMSNEMFVNIKRVKLIAKKIIVNEMVRDICITMQIVNFNYLLIEGVHTSVLSMLIAAVMGQDDEEIYNIGVAALIHDIGLCEMPYLITVEELESNTIALWEEHTTYGYYMMIEKNVPREIAELIYAHHERYDGEGFPRKLCGEAIPLGSRIIKLCADYIENIHKKGLPPYEAIEYIYANSNAAYDTKVVWVFTNHFAVYPLGALVELTTGEIGAVINIRKNKGPRPLVRIHFNRVLKPLSEPKIIDLGIDKTIFIKRIINY